MRAASWRSVTIRPGWVRGRIGLGRAGKGDFQAEFLQFADVVGDLAAALGAALVVVGSEVVVSHAGVGQELVVDLQLGVAEGDAGFGLAAAAGELALAGAFAVSVLPAEMAVSPVAAATYLLPFLCRERPWRLPDWWSSGARPARETRWPPVGNLLMSGAGLGEHVLGRAAPPARLRLGLLQRSAHRHRGTS